MCMSECECGLMVAIPEKSQCNHLHCCICSICSVMCILYRFLANWATGKYQPGHAVTLLPAAALILWCLHLCLHLLTCCRLLSCFTCTNSSFAIILPNPVRWDGLVHCHHGAQQSIPGCDSQWILQAGSPVGTAGVAKQCC